MLMYIIYALQALSAAAIVLQKRVVFSPKITYPTASTVWNVGEVQNVTWSIADAPPGFPINTATGTLLLGFLEDGSDSEHLDIDHPLADKFLIKDTHVQITVPVVQTREDYILVLLGDSGNASPKFTIHNITISNPGKPSSTTTSASSTASSNPSPTSSADDSSTGSNTSSRDASTSLSSTPTPTAPLQSSTSVSLTTLLVAPTPSAGTTAAAAPSTSSPGAAIRLLDGTKISQQMGVLTMAMAMMYLF